MCGYKGNPIEIDSKPDITTTGSKYQIGENSMAEF